MMIYALIAGAYLAISLVLAGVIGHGLKFCESRDRRRREAELQASMRRHPAGRKLRSVR